MENDDCCLSNSSSCSNLDRLERIDCSRSSLEEGSRDGIRSMENELGSGIVDGEKCEEGSGVGRNVWRVVVVVDEEGTETMNASEIVIVSENESESETWTLKNSWNVGTSIFREVVEQLEVQIRGVEPVA